MHQTIFISYLHILQNSPLGVDGYTEEQNILMKHLNYSGKQKSRGTKNIHAI